MGAFLPHKKKAQQDSQKKNEVLCAIYTRKSTDENLDGYNSLHAQRDSCLNFIQSREGIGWKEYPEAYDDPGYSGKNMERPALSKLISDAKKKRFSVVVCYKYDRLSRNTRDFLHILDLFDKHGVSFVSITQNIDTSTSSGRLLRQILVDFGQFEREMISERTRDKMAAMAAKGKWLGSYPQLGYNYNREMKRLEINEEEAKQVRELFNTYLVKKSLLFTSLAMNEKGYRMKSWLSVQSKMQKGGALFNKKTLQGILTNPLYLGKIYYKGSLYNGEHSGIVDEETFYKVQNMLHLNRNGVEHRTKTVNTGYQPILKKLLRCKVCGYAMTSNYAYSRGKTYHYYLCVPVNKLGAQGCSVKRVPAKEIDNFVLSRLKELANHPEIITELVKKANDRIKDFLPEKNLEKRELASELGRIELDSANLLKMVTDAQRTNSPAIGFYNAELEKLAQKKKDTETKIFKIDGEIRELEERKFSAEVIHNNLKNFDELLQRMDPHSKDQLVRLVIKAVEYDGRNKQITIDYFAISLMDKDFWASHVDFLNRVKDGVIDGT